MSIGVAILGAGNVVHDEHFPAVQTCALLSLKAVYSRSQVSAEQLVQSTTEPIGTYFDTPALAGRSLDDLLARKDIDAVIIALPIPVQPGVIKKALRAGKHVLSEKPIARDVETAVELVRCYDKIKEKTIWLVGANFRFLESIALGTHQIQKLGGDVVTFSVTVYGFVDEHDKFYRTAWRQKPEYQGGFLLDGGIHYVAGLRYLLAAAGQSITQVFAFTSLLQPKLAPLDTVHATMQLENGNSGTFSLSFGAEFKTGFELQVVTDKGAVTVLPAEVIVLAKDSAAEKKEKRTKVRPGAGGKAEVLAFAHSIKFGRADERLTPEQALLDLKVLQAMLDSGKEANALKRVDSGR